MYPAFLVPPPTPLSFSDQFAFRPSGSTTAALITILHTVTGLLATNQFVIIIDFEFSKAYDTVRHSTLLNKYFQLYPGPYNWLVEYFCGRMHCTKYGLTSAMLEISASIIQGSAIGPASFVVAAADLCCVTLGNNLCKYADNTRIIIPASNVHSRAAEINNVEAWARINNLHLNCTKCAEIIFTSSRRARSAASLPPTLPDIARVSSLKILGVCHHLQQTFCQRPRAQNVVASSADSACS